MSVIYFDGEYAYRARPPASKRGSAHKIIEIALSAECKRARQFYLFQYASDVDPNDPMVSLELSDLRAHYLALGFIEKITLLSWDGFRYAPAATLRRAAS